MFKPLPADPALLQKLQIRNRIASLTAFAILILWPIANSFMLVSLQPEYLVALEVALNVGSAIALLMIPASVFFFVHGIRYRNLLRYLSQNPPVYPAMNPAESDVKQLQSKKIMAIVWHSITLGVPVAYVAAAIATKSFTATPTSLVFVGAILFMFAVTGGLALSVVSINAYLSFKAKLLWAFPDAQPWSAASTSKTS
jgi:hypothetical protein